MYNKHETIHAKLIYLVYQAGAHGIRGLYSFARIVSGSNKNKRVEYFLHNMYFRGKNAQLCMETIKKIIKNVLFEM